MGFLSQLIGALIGLAIWILILYFTIKAAVTAAQERIAQGMANIAGVLNAQANLTQQLAKHLVAQTELMLAQAKHQGMTDDQLDHVVKQVAERKADPAMSLPFS